MLVAEGQQPSDEHMNSHATKVSLTAFSKILLLQVVRTYADTAVPQLP
jgi:hypothetical protein